MVTTDGAVLEASSHGAAGTALTKVRAASCGRLRTLDGLRFLAAVGVMLYHYTASLSNVWDEPSGARFPVLGHIAMYFALAPQLFFVLSGFVVLWTAWGRSVPQVVASRAARLLPAYWAALALTSVLLLVIWPEGRHISGGQVVVNATLLQGLFGVSNVDGVYWTLWAELRFYVLVALLVAWGLTRRRVLVFAAVWPIVGVVADHSRWEHVSTALIGSNAVFFAGGMLLFLIWRDGHAWLPWILVCANVLLGVWAVGLPMVARLRYFTVFEPSPMLVAAVVVACFAAVAITTLTPLSRWDWSTLTTVGALTYPLYLVHMTWGWWVIDHLHTSAPTYLTLAAAIAVAVALALAVHHGVEQTVSRPMRRRLEDALVRARATRIDQERMDRTSTAGLTTAPPPELARAVR